MHHLLLLGTFRSNIQENVDLIKLQRDMKEKATKYEALHAKCLSLEEVAILLSKTQLISFYVIFTFRTKLSYFQLVKIIYQ